MKHFMDALLQFFNRKSAENDVDENSLSSYLIGDHIFKTTNKGSK